MVELPGSAFRSRFPEAFARERLAFLLTSSQSKNVLRVVEPFFVFVITSPMEHMTSWSIIDTGFLATGGPWAHQQIDLTTRDHGND